MDGETVTSFRGDIANLPTRIEATQGAEMAQKQIWLGD